MVLLGDVALPLGLVTAAQDRRDFTDETDIRGDARWRNVAEERLDDGTSGAGLDRTGRQLAATATASGSLTARAPGRGTASRRQATAAQLSRGRRRPRPAAYQLDDYVLVVAPVRSDNGTGSLGAVALARPTAPVDQRIALLWTLIGAVSAAGLLAAALVAIGLARWVSRPLGALEAPRSSSATAT